MLPSDPQERHPHTTRPVRVWADIDIEVAHIVEYLNMIPGVRTCASCQGTIGEGGPNPYRAQVLCDWSLEVLPRLQAEFDVYPEGNGNWGYIKPKNGADRFDDPPPAPSEPNDELTGTADDQLWSSAEVAAMLAVLKGIPAPIERPEELKDLEAQLERLRGVEFGDLRSYAVLARDSLRYVLALEVEVLEVRSTALHNFKEFEAANRLMHEQIAALEAECSRLCAALLVSERFAESQRILKGTNIQRWTQAQEKLAAIESRLISMTGQQADIGTNLDTLFAMRKEVGQ